MSSYTIRVIIEERFGRVVAEACAPMAGEFQDVIQPLRTSDAALPIFDTQNAVVQRVRATRKEYEKALTPALAKVLLDAMEAKDLFNGYTKKENEEWKS